jgi:hypothetical protein
MTNLSKEQLEEIVAVSHQFLDADEETNGNADIQPWLNIVWPLVSLSMARELLQHREAEEKPVSAEWFDPDTNKWLPFLNADHKVRTIKAGYRVRELYTTPPLPVIPDDWKWVPIEPTEEMVIDGFESEPDEGFSSAEEWEAYTAMSGCEQAAHRARLCYSAMIAAAPNIKEGK